VGVFNGREMATVVLQWSTAAPAEQRQAGA